MTKLKFKWISWRYKSKLKPKDAISAEMLDTTNTYDKVAVIRMIVGDEAGRVSSVFKNMMEKNKVESEIKMAEAVKKPSADEVYQG